MGKCHLFTKGTRQIRDNVRFKNSCTNFDARRCIRHICANEGLAPSSLVPQIMHSCAKNVFSHSVHKMPDEDFEGDFLEMQENNHGITKAASAALY
jgi:hypothetical protein